MPSLAHNGRMSDPSIRETWGAAWTLLKKCLGGCLSYGLGFQVVAALLLSPFFVWAGDRALSLSGAPVATNFDIASAVLSLAGIVVFRMPVVPNLNDSRECVLEVAEFLRQLGQDNVWLLPFHRGAEGKLPRLETHQSNLEISAQAVTEAVERTAAIFTDAGITCRVDDGRRGKRPDDAQRGGVPTTAALLRPSVAVA